MKLIDSTTAVKVPIEKGMEFPDQIEILNPVFKTIGSDSVSPEIMVYRIRQKSVS